MKILFVHNRYSHEGGEEHAIANLEQLLTAKGHAVFRLERSSQEWDPWNPWQTGKGAIQTIYSRNAGASLDRAVAAFHPDVIHVHNVFPLLSPSIYWYAHRQKVPVVQTIHNYRFLCANGLFLTPKGEICERCKGGSFWNAIRFGCYGNSRMRTLPMATSLAFHRAIKTFERCITLYLTPSEFARSKLLEAGFPQDRIQVLAHPVATPAVHEQRSDTPLFLYVGRLSLEKGLWTLLKAFADFREGKLKIMGDGPLRTSLQDYVSQRALSNVEFLGSKDSGEVSRWLARAWALVLPSECYETFGQVILEAWSCGTPVVASRLGSLAELVQEGRTGWTFAAGDAGQLSHQLQDIAKNGSETRRLSSNCLAAARNLCDENHIYESLMDAYERARHLVTAR